MYKAIITIRGGNVVTYEKYPLAELVSRIDKLENVERVVIEKA